MKLFAISDLHVRHGGNRELLEALEAHPSDWLIVAGDVGESVADLARTLDLLGERFARLIWVPGNHELWTVPREPGEEALRGEAKYEALVACCRARGVLTPEDPYVELPEALAPGDAPTFLVPMFLLYDYSFRPASVTREGALAWAQEAGIVCADEHMLHPDPYPSRDAWCAARVAATAERLDALPEGARTVLVNHFPLRQRHAVLPLVPRFSLWCGTTRTDDWHLRYRARAVVYGHLHIPRTRIDDGVPFEEVSMGYPRERRYRPAHVTLLRQVLPRA